MKPVSDPVRRYFAAVDAALEGLDTFLRDDTSTLYRHDLVASVVVEHVARLRRSFSCWRNRLGFAEQFKISRAESGFPVFQNVMELAKDRTSAKQRLASIPDADTLRAEMADFILRHKEFPEALQETMAERLYLEDVEKGELFTPFVLPKTIRVSVNPKTRRPYYIVQWATFDGSEHLPLIYMATIEDSSDNIVSTLVTRDGKLDESVDVPLPVGGLLNPELAHRFDDFAERNSSFSLSPATIANNLDKDFDTLHPKQLRRVVLGPFYSAGITANNSVITDILGKVGREDNAWLLTWTVQEVFSKHENPGRKGLWSSEPSRQEFHIETDDLEAARQGVSKYQKHALVPHEAYQAIYAAGQQTAIFGGYTVHVISGGQVITDV